MKVTIPLRVDADELWSDVFGSAYETWDWWQGLSFYDDAAWDKAGKARITSWAPDDTDRIISTDVTIEDIVEAYTTLVNKGWTHCNGCGVGEPDACTGDAILQTIVYGELVYG